MAILNGVGDMIRTWYGPLSITSCKLIMIIRGTGALMTCFIFTAIVTFKFMFICVWKSMRQMNDNLLALVMFNISLFLSLFFCLTIPRVSFPTRNQESLLSSMAKVVIDNLISHKPGRAYSNLVQTKSDFESQLDPPVTLTDLTLSCPRSLLKTTPTPPGYPWVSGGRYVTPEPRFRGLVLDHQLLKEPEPKNHSKRAKFDQKQQFLGVF